MSCRTLRSLISRKFLRVNYFVISRFDSTSISKNNPPNEDNENVGGFAKAFIKHTHISETPPQEEAVSFATLLRNSKFIDLGDPEGRILTGTIFHIVKDDLYIDFGWKFHCVCPRPSKDGSQYVRGAKVRLRLKDLELSTRFLGFEKDLTLLEADAQIIGLVYTPARGS